MRRVSTIVLPEPAAATTASGDASVVTATHCSRVEAAQHRLHLLRRLLLGSERLAGRHVRVHLVTIELRSAHDVLRRRT